MSSGMVTMVLFGMVVVVIIVDVITTSTSMFDSCVFGIIIEFGISIQHLWKGKVAVAVTGAKILKIQQVDSQFIPSWSVSR